MLERTHVRIAQEITKKLCIDQEPGNLLESGSIRPDSYIEFPHHKEQENLILGDILDARALYLNNDDEAFVKLGEACHFIADKWTLRPRTDDKHFQWESKIETCEIQKDTQFAKELREAVIPSKAKEFYEKLLIAVEDLMTEQDFTQKKPAITELVEKQEERLEIAQSLFLLHYCPRMMGWGIFGGLEVAQKLPPRSELIPFPLVSHIAWITREGTGADTYSTPAIDLNISLRICMAACRFALSKSKDIFFQQRIMDWDDLPKNWREVLNKYIKDLNEQIIQKTEQEKKFRFKLF